MLTYLYVAIGGAVGSVARAWISVLSVRLLGPAFPWGTVAINVVGSFAIAFFGVLTAAESRFPLSADARAFIMVGICGGFTTFSSFSLQTLDLARAGRPGLALANIALSFVLCLGSVTAGYATAVSLNGRTPDRLAKSRGTQNDEPATVALQADATDSEPFTAKRS